MGCFSCFDSREDQKLNPHGEHDHDHDHLRKQHQQHPHPSNPALPSHISRLPSG
ncbi:hypothetical protein PIB30_116017 [Stylosanthes scabra]|nr:hypothetical protein [Stylosanthes scabra]